MLQREFSLATGFQPSLYSNLHARANGKTTKDDSIQQMGCLGAFLGFSSWERRLGRSTYDMRSRHSEFRILIPKFG